MKKRILALALAGTTAFSVFGAALSANAWDSTHTAVNNDVYVSYQPVAEEINSTAGTVAVEGSYVDTKTGTTFTGSKDKYLASLTTIKENFTAGYKVNGMIFDANGFIDGNTADFLSALNITKTKDGKFLYDNTTYDKQNLAVAAYINANGGDSTKADYFFNPDLGKTSNPYSIDKTAYGALTNKSTYDSTNIKEITAPVTGADGTLTVDGSSAANWVFNADTTGDATIDFFVYDGVTAGSKKVQPTVFAYDFVYSNNVTASASNIANAWNSKNPVSAANVIGTMKLKAETGTGVSYRGIRFDVVNEWVDFLEELAINHDNGYRESRDAFISLYRDMYYGDPVYDASTGQLIGYNYVDLYNIDDLLNDIYDLSARYADAYNGITGWDQANTSEMVYLMQQYDKYIGNYISTEPVSTSEWGELMLSVLESANAEDFNKATDYTKYMNRVEELAEAYETATTANMVKAAEQGMYDMLTNSVYRASKTASVEELNNTMEGLYFNVGSVPTTYTTAYKTVNSNNVEYKNYSYFYIVESLVKNDMVNVQLTKGNKYYSLYPMADYAQTGNTNAVYTGNKTTKGDAEYVKGATTDEYQWFWNVYQLAANMKASNKYQGSVDAINEALNTAVEELAVTTTPYNSQIAAVEDVVKTYEGKIESDYNAGYYAKYTQANDYAANVAEGRSQQYVAFEIAAIAGDALTWQGTQVTVSKNDMKTVETAIKNGEAALKAIKEDSNYNAAQVNALNKAIAGAQYIVDLYNGVASRNNKAVQSVNHEYTNYVGDKDQIVKSDLTAAIEAIDAAINYSEIVMGWSKNEAGKWMYGTEEGYLTNGWNKIGKTWFYFNADGTAKQSEWFQENGTWYWFNSNCGAACGWAKVDGEWYYFKGNNAMKTGWEKVDGNWYYMASSGKMVTGWCEIGGKWYYFSKESNSLGQMLYSTTVDGYKLDANGVWVK